MGENNFNSDIWLSKGLTAYNLRNYEEAIEYFKKAAGGLPESKVINANAAQALMMHIQKNGTNEQHIYQASQYLERVKKIDPSFDKYQKLLNMYEKITAPEKNPVT